MMRAILDYGWGATAMKPKTFDQDMPGKAMLARQMARFGSSVAAARMELNSGVLFAGSSEVVINHGAEIYHLRLTRQNKLILTK